MSASGLREVLNAYSLARVLVARAGGFKGGAQIAA